MLGLQEAGYDSNNPNHQIISCGDNFGRASTGEKSKGIYKYLISKEHINKPICIRGNHESILLDVFRKGYLSYIDICNGEDKSIASFAHCSIGEAKNNPEKIQIASTTGVEKFIMDMPWYYETPNYIFTHGWLPTHHGKYLEDYVKVSMEEWDEASWARTEERILKHREIYPDGWKKTIVFGHWHAFQLAKTFGNNNLKTEPSDFWIDNKSKLIGLDCCTALYHKLNVLVIED